MENNQPPNPPFSDEGINIGYAVKDFYTVDFKALFLTFFTNPFAGILAIFRNPSEKSFVHSMVLYGSVFVLYFLGSYLLSGDMREYMSFGSFLSIGLIPVLVMLSISGLSFLIKAVIGRANFKSELLTGALCGIPLGLLIPLGFVIKVFGDGGDLMMLYRNPMGTGLIMSVVMLYLLMMMINVFQQSLQAGGTKQMLAWYLSPLSVLISFYIAFSLFANLQ